MADESVQVLHKPDVSDLVIDELTQNVPMNIRALLFSISDNPIGRYDTDVGMIQVDRRSVILRLEQPDGLRRVELHFDAEGNLTGILRVVGSGAAEIQVVAGVVTPGALPVTPAQGQAGTQGGRRRHGGVRMDSGVEKCAVVITDDPHGLGAIAALSGWKGKTKGSRREELLGNICIQAGLETRTMSLEHWGAFVYQGPVKYLYNTIKPFVIRENGIGELLNAAPVSTTQQNPRLSVGAKGGKGAYWMRFVSEETCEDITRLLEDQAALCNPTQNDASRPLGAPAAWLPPRDARENPRGYGMETGGPAREILGPAPLRQAQVLQHPYHYPVSDRRSNPPCSPHGGRSSFAFS